MDRYDEFKAFVDPQGDIEKLIRRFASGLESRKSRHRVNVLRELEKEATSKVRQSPAQPLDIEEH